MDEKRLDFFLNRRYQVLLGVLIVLLVIEPIVSSHGILQSMFDILLVVVLAVLVLAMANEKGWRLVAVFFCVPAAALSLGGHLMSTTHQNIGLSIGQGLAALFFILVAGKIIATIIWTREISLDSIYGAVCGYLLIGVAWGLAYTVVQFTDPEAFDMSEVLQHQLDEAEGTRNLFVYYSFVTLTTVGYGDLTPSTEVARTLAWVESVVGQLYLGILIAGLMSALVAKRINVDRSSNQLSE